MKHITFKYRDQYTFGIWKTQSCTVSSVQECIHIYGLNDGYCEYEILSVEDVNG